MVSKTSIVNKALTELGAETISSINDNNPRAKLFLAIYSIVRDCVLEDGKWNFAMKRIALSPDATPPDFEWTNRFLKPTDCVKIVEEYNEVEYEEEGDYLLSDEATLQLKYISRVTEETKFSPGFVNAFALKLALEAGYKITQDKALIAQLKQRYDEAIMNARTNVAQNSSPEEVTVDSFLGFRSSDW
jgi:hypothetical protein